MTGAAPAAAKISPMPRPDTAAPTPDTRTLNTVDAAHPRHGFDRFFMISRRGSSIAQEVRGGLATFLAMSYIIVLNPLVLSGADANGDTLGIARVAAVTALVAGVATIAGA